MRLSSAAMSLRVSSSVDQITCLTPAALRGVGDVLRLLLLLLGGEVLPEVRHAVHAVGAGERLLQALDVVDVGLDHLGARGLERLRLVLARIARDCASRESAVRIGQNRTRETAALGAGRTHHRDDFLVCHCFEPQLQNGRAFPSE